MVNLRSLSLFLSIPALVFIMGGCKKHVEPTTQPPVRVSVVSVDSSNIDDCRVFSGTVKAESVTPLSFQVAGTITGIYVEEGQKVSKGQLIARIDDSDYRNADNIAKAQLDEAIDAYGRFKTVYENNGLPEIKWIEIQNKLKQAQNAAELSARTLGDATLNSTISGVVSRKIANVGQSVVPVEPIVEILSIDKLSIDIPVTESQIGAIAIGDSALVRFNTLGIEGIYGKVVNKDVVADPLTRSYTVKISLPADDRRILPGMVGDVTFLKNETIGNELTSICLPSQAVLLSSDNRNFVWIVKDGKAQRRFVIADELVRNGVAVKDGLNPGDSVIVEGMNKVGSGTCVEAVPYTVDNK